MFFMMNFHRNVFRRTFTISCVAYSLKKQGLKLNKMLNPKVKKQWYPNHSFNSESLPSIKSLTKVQRQPGKQGLRRIAMLNKIFMKHITDLMSTGTVSMDIVGRGIEISKVKVTPDLRAVNVFWVSKGDLSDVDTEAILNKTAGVLRHELSTLRVMGEIPYIIFVKDKLEAQVIDLDRRLSIADYGDDYTPTDLGHLLKSEFMLDTKLSPEMKAKIKQLEESTDVVEEPIPEMTHTVFDLDHAKIMGRLLASRKRTKDAWSSLNQNPNVISYRSNKDIVPDVDTVKQKKELAEFLLKRQILQNKLHKKMFDSRDELNLIDEELSDDDEPYYDDLEDPNDEFDEYDRDGINAMDGKR